MCTLSWRFEGRGYRVLFNRDEQKSREPATPPQRGEAGGIPFLAPRDGRAGGSWLAANARGLTVALLNYYDAAPAPPPPGRGPTASRGALVLALAGCADLAALRRGLPAAQRADRYAPFWLFGIAPGAAAALWSWDGMNLLEHETPGERFITTSSFATPEVLAARRRERAALGPDPGADALRALHRGHDPGRPAHSIRMRRPDAQTVSYSEVAAAAGRVTFRYRPEPTGSLGELPETVAELPALFA